MKKFRYNMDEIEALCEQLTVAELGAVLAVIDALSGKPADPTGKRRDVGPYAYYTDPATLVEPAEPGSVVASQGSSEYPTVYVRQGDGLSDGRHWLCGQQWVSWEMILANRGPECVYLLAPKYR